MTSKPFYDQIGGLDENLYFYNEDIDFAIKSKQTEKKYITALLHTSPITVADPQK